ncbi:MAG: hypothetical protein JWM97_1385, partial [Phycisphaerales bacterium]|nr:hypothetical protein [Phycisphaerales bacterium]
MPPDEAARTQNDYSRWLADRRAGIDAELHDGARAEAAWSWARLLAFALAAVIWYPFKAIPTLAGVAVVAAIALFAATIAMHRRVWLRREFLRSQLTVAKESAERAGGQVTVVRRGARPMDITLEGGTPPPLLPAGKTWPLTEQERDDLDLYASPSGLFGLLNRASTHVGATRLRDDLENPRLEPNRILARQAAIRWLGAHHAERLRLLAALEGVRRLDDSLAGFAEAVAGARLILPTPLAWVARIWSIAGIVLAAFAIDRIAAGDRIWAAVPVSLLLLNVALLGPFWTRLRQWQQRWEQAASFAEGYLAVARQACADLPSRDVAPSPPAVNDVAQTNTAEGGSATLELATLRDAFARVARAPALPAALRWMHWAAGGGLIQIVLNAFALYHVHVLERLHRHIVPHREALRA